MRLAVVGALVLVTACSSSEAPAPKPTRSTPTSIVLDSPDHEPTTEPSPTAKPTCAIENSNVTLTYETATKADGGVTITVHSNLPDGAKLMVSLQKGDYGAQTYMADDTNFLSGGSATFGPYSDKGDPLSGTYLLDISMSVARLQSAEVRECIGDKGEQLKGPLVQKDEIEGGHWLRFERTVTLGP